MKRTILALLAVALIAPAAAQVPTTLPANTVVGRLGVGSGPAQAIPFATFIAQNNLLQNSSGSVTVIVDHTSGIDQAGCGTGTGGNACNTILFAYQQLQTTGRVGRGGLATIQSDCNFTETPGAAFLGPSGTGGAGGGVVFIKGNETTPSACAWTSNGIVVDDGAVISLRGFKTINAASGKTWLTVTKMGLAVFANVQWSTATGGAHVAIGDGGVFVYDGGTYQVGDSGCAPSCFNYHIINNGGFFEMFAATVSVPSVLSFTAWYNGVGSGSNTNFGVNTFTGAGSGAGSTGTQYILGKNATIPFYSGQLTFPGATAGTIATGACVDNTCAPILLAQVPVGGTNLQFLQTNGSGTGAWASTRQIIPISNGAVAQAQNTTAFEVTLSNSSEALVQAVCPMAGTFKNLYVQSAAPASGQTLTATFRVANADTAITCTVTGVGTTCNDTTHTAACTVGQAYSLKTVTSATTGSLTAISAGVEFDNP